jgi:DNA-binding XRE family transcriptional regulator
VLTRFQLRKLRTLPLGDARNKVRLARELMDPKLTQVELAKRLQKSQAFVSAIELGDYSAMTLDTSRAIAAVFGCTVDDLFPADAQAVA